MVTTQYDVPLTRIQAQQIDLHLTPGVGNRLVAEMALRDVSQHHQVHYLSEITGRALQTVARWIDPDKPGMPDLRSLALLSIQFGVDANWLLGLSAHRIPFRGDLLPATLAAQLTALPSGPGDWMKPLLDQTTAFVAQSVATMRGTDMEPVILDGSPFFFDPAALIRRPPRSTAAASTISSTAERNSFAILKFGSEKACFSVPKTPRASRQCSRTSMPRPSWKSSGASR
jgi:hypothetical protein